MAYPPEAGGGHLECVRSGQGMKKIGLFFVSGHKGGVRQYTLSVLEAVAALPKDNYEVVIYAEKNSFRDLQDYEFTIVNAATGSWKRGFGKILRILGLSMRWYRSISPFFNQVLKDLMHQNFDLLIFTSPYAYSYQAPLPAIVAIHDLMHRYEAHFPEVSVEFKQREIDYANICRWARAVLVDSDVGKRQVQESYEIDPDNIYVLPFVPSKTVYSYINSDKVKITHSNYRLPDKFLFYPAQFWKHKNHKGLIKATALLKDKIPDLRLVFVGSEMNGYRKSRELVKNLGLEENIFFLGYLPDEEIPGLFRQARALIMPTFFGPTNIPPLEAMVLGCPVSVSDIYAMREQLGDAALYFNPASVTEIAQTMERLWQDDALCRELSHRGLVRSSQRTQMHFNNRLRNIIDEVLSNEGRL